MPISKPDLDAFEQDFRDRNPDLKNDPSESQLLGKALQWVSTEETNKATPTNPDYERKGKDLTDADLVKLLGYASVKRGNYVKEYSEFTVTEKGPVVGHMLQKFCMELLAKLDQEKAA